MDVAPVDDSFTQALLVDLLTDDTMERGFTAYQAHVEQDPAIETTLAVCIMQAMIAKVVGVSDAEASLVQQRLGQFALQTYATPRTTFEIPHLRFINTVFFDTHAILAKTAQDDARRLFVVQFCSTVSEYFFNVSSPPESEDARLTIAYCRDAWLGFLSFARTDEPTPDFGLLTCVWKVASLLSTSVVNDNLTRLCTAYRAQFAAAEPTLASTLCHSLQRSVHSQLTCLEQQMSSSTADIALNLVKTLRLLFKAYTSIFACFADHVSVDKVSLTRPTYASRPSQFHDAVEFMGTTAAAVFQAQLAARPQETQLVDTLDLLIQDTLGVLDKALKQPRLAAASLHPWVATQLVESLESPPGDACGLFKLLALLKPGVGSPGQVEATTVARYLDQLFLWGRTVVAQLPSPRRTLLITLLVEPTVALVFVGPPPAHVYRTQLHLLSYSFHASVYQERLCQLVWRRVFQTLWAGNHPAGIAFVECILQMLTTPFQALPRPADDRTALRDLLASFFDVLSPAQQTTCLAGALEAVNTLCADGPDHEATPALVANVELLEHLVVSGAATAHMTSGNFVEGYLAMCFECFGTALDVLAAGADDDADLAAALWRVLDAALLVCRGILRPQATPADHPVALCLHPFLIRLLAMVKTLPPSDSIVAARVLDGAFDLLRRHTLLKSNRGNEYLAMLQHVCRLPPRHRIAVAHFAAFLADVRVAVDAVADCYMVRETLCGLFARLLTYPSPWPVMALGLQGLHSFLATSNVAVTDADPVRALLLQHAPTLREYFGLLLAPPTTAPDACDRLAQLQVQQDATFDGRRPSVCPPAPRKRTADDLLDTSRAIKRLQAAREATPEIVAAVAHAATALDAVLALLNEDAPTGT
ncbi:hypothetical protein ACHHYP_15138 [Achlya hypogyna]|uniref:Uncharacterized protein n=1 Tax=Achlya hypogyna TaxID=1202772 RepID=A0A1V9ZF65_ACHHY|nr:hypothetical protein ACHHYP_15138 [Achlya hypogyna]